MKTSIHLLFIHALFLTLSVTACKSNVASSTVPKFLKCWAHSYEEDTQDGVQHYRPCATHTFPASRYRNTFTLKENGEIEYSVLAPNDAHTNENGTWTYDAGSKTLKIFDSKKSPVTEYQVVSVGDDLLELRQ